MPISIEWQLHFANIYSVIAPERFTEQHLKTHFTLTNIFLNPDHHELAMRRNIYGHYAECHSARKVNIGVVRSGVMIPDTVQQLRRRWGSCVVAGRQVQTPHMPLARTNAGPVPHRSGHERSRAPHAAPMMHLARHGWSRCADLVPATMSEERRPAPVARAMPDEY